MKSIRIAIPGASGKMGQALLSALATEANLIVGDLASGAFDVLIDFTRPEGTLNFIDQCLKYGKPMVIGTTGLNDAQKARIFEAAKTLPIVFAPNMSPGINLCFDLIARAAKTLKNAGFDIDVIEAHHRHKVDAPSGTALKMGEILKASTENKQPIQFSSIRGGDIVGDHTVLFSGLGERIEITHRASSRETFARGALAAARWVSHQAPGLYDMRSVLSL